MDSRIIAWNEVEIRRRSKEAPSGCWEWIRSLHPKGRSGKYAGRRNPAAVLVEADVLAARSLVKRGWQRKALAALFGVSPSALGAAVASRTWKHV